MVVTGAANSGKSTWTNQLVAQMNIEHGCKVAIASFEMRINPFVSDLLLMVHKEQGKKFQSGLQWINENFVFIAPEPDNENEIFDVDWLLEKAAMAVIRYGIRILVIDPWNEIEHAVGRRESMTEYVGRAIRSLKRFGRKFGVLVIVVAHPSKAGAMKASRAENVRKIKEKNPDYAEEPEDLSLYDISDTAHFANKADFGVVLTRIGGGNMTEVSVVKIRYQPVSGLIGKDTICFKSYDPKKAGMFGQ
jgi:twinkle protein